MRSFNFSGNAFLSKLQNRTRHILRGELEPDVRCADVMELLGHDVLRVFWWCRLQSILPRRCSSSRKAMSA